MANCAAKHIEANNYKLKNYNTMTDNRGREIKKMLIKAFPNGDFRVRLHKYSMGESINIKTNLLKYGWQECLNHGKLENGAYCYKCSTPSRYINPTVEIEKQIKSMVSKYESIDRDEATGEILSGGNTYVFVDPI